MAGVGAARLGLDMYMWRNRQTNKQRRFLRIVVNKVDADGQPLHNLHEIAGCILRRQNRERRAGAYREPRDSPRKFLSAAVHINVNRDRLADAKLCELRLFEVRIDPNVADRADGHNALAGYHVVTWVHAPPRDDTVDLSQHLAIAQIQFRLV